MCCRNELNAKGAKGSVNGQEETLETERALRFDLLAENGHIYRRQHPGWAPGDRLCRLMGLFSGFVILVIEILQKALSPACFGVEGISFGDISDFVRPPTSKGSGAGEYPVELLLMKPLTRKMTWRGLRRVNHRITHCVPAPVNYLGKLEEHLPRGASRHSHYEQLSCSRPKPGFDLECEAIHLPPWPSLPLGQPARETTVQLELDSP